MTRRATLPLDMPAEGAAGGTVTGREVAGGGVASNG